MVLERGPAPFAEMSTNLSESNVFAAAIWTTLDFSVSCSEKILLLFLKFYRFSANADSGKCVAGEGEARRPWWRTRQRARPRSAETLILNKKLPVRARQ